MAAARICRIRECERPCHQRNGFTHNYCGRTHAAEAVRRQMERVLRNPHGRCHICCLNGCSRNVHYEVETGRVHDFCSQTHAHMAIERGEWPPHGSGGNTMCDLQECRRSVYRNPDTGEDSRYCSWKHRSASIRILGDTCDNYNCDNSPYIDLESCEIHNYCSSRCALSCGDKLMCLDERCSLPGCADNVLALFPYKSLGFCSVDHAMRAADRSLVPRAEAHVDRTFCGGTTSATDFKLSVLNSHHPSYKSLKKQFQKKWLKGNSADSVKVNRIFKIKVPADVHDNIKEYQGRVGNVRRRFHGTSCSTACTFFMDLKGGPCGEKECAVCNICTHGFELGYSGRTARSSGVGLRFGPGLYFSSVSGKANDYAGRSEKIDGDKRIRCMFMASVVVGRPFSTQSGTLPPEQCPPSGYDSVIGEPGVDLNYDEVVVYHEEAALPTFLIVYTLKE